MAELYLLRHFPTEWNIDRRIQGKTDIPLSCDSLTQLKKSLCLKSGNNITGFPAHSCVHNKLLTRWVLQNRNLKAPWQK